MNQLDIANADERAKFALGHNDGIKWNFSTKLGVFEGKDLNDPYYRGRFDFGLLLPDYYVQKDGNLLLTAGATALWNGLVTSGLATPFNATNGQIAIGDSATVASVGQTDLQAAAGASLGGGITAASNATPIVLTTSTSHGVLAGQEVVVASVGGNAAANGTFEAQSVTSNTITLKNSAGNGAYTSGGTVKLINYYRQLISGAPTVSTNQVQFTSIFGTTNGNFAWNEWGVSTGGGVTNQQAQPPPTLFNRAAPSGGLLTKTSNVSVTFTVTITVT